jgi:dTDP-4-dehydrorhamnose reductase
MKKILVTGANGQLGSELRLIAGNWPQFDFLFTDVNELDICNASAVDAFVADNAVDVIVNCAAYTAVDKAESDEPKATVLNAVAPGYLAAAIEKRGGAMVQISTDYVFPGNASQPVDEDAPVAPASVYGRTKLAGEKAALAACRNTVIIRTAWLYSTFGNNFVKTMLRLGRERNTLGVVFDQVGTPTYARDLAAAIMQILAKGIVPGVYHFTDEGVASWYDFTVAIHKFAGICGCRVSPIHTADYPTPAARPAYSVLDKSKIKRTYGIEIPYWADSVKQCVESLLKSENSL